MLSKTNLVYQKSIFTTTCRGLILYLGCIISFVWCSCTTNNSTSNATDYSIINIDNTKLLDTLDISREIENVKIIMLKDSASKPLSRIDQLYAINDKYIAIDAINTKRVNAYSADGTYLKTLMENGPAIDDALNVTDCYVNNKNEIIVYDFARMELTLFDPSLTEKKKIRGQKLFHYHHIATIPGTDKYVGYSAYNLPNSFNEAGKRKPSSLDFLSNKLDLDSRQLGYPSKFEGITLITSSKSFFPYKDSLRFFRTYDPYIYNVNKNNIEIKYKIEYSKGNMPSNFLETIVEPYVKDLKNIGRNSNSLLALYSLFNGFSSPKNWLESENTIYLSSLTFSESSVKIFNSIQFKSGKSPIVLNAYTFADKDNFQLSFPQFTAYDKNTKEFLASCSGNQLRKQLFKGSKLINPETIVDDNFYIIKVKLKRDRF